MAYPKVVVLRHDGKYHGIMEYTVAEQHSDYPDFYGISMGDPWAERGSELNHTMEHYHYTIVAKFQPAPYGYKVKPLTIGGRKFYV